MKTKIENLIKESRETKSTLADKESVSRIEESARIITDSLKAGGKVIIFGNGGSAADSQHMAAELVGRFQKERGAMPAIALTTNTSTLTALANDYGYDIAFKRQIEALGKKGDVAIGISTSGEAQSVTEAVRTANELGLKTIGITGKTGGSLKDEANTTILVRSNVTARIQEAHILIIHIICELVENEWQGKKS